MNDTFLIGGLTILVLAVVMVAIATYSPPVLVKFATTSSVYCSDNVLYFDDTGGKPHAVENDRYSVTCTVHSK